MNYEIITNRQMTINQRVKNVVELVGITQAELAREVGMKSQSTISKIFKGEVGVSESIFIFLSERYNVNIEYLMTGRGEIFKSDEAGFESTAERVLAKSKKIEVPLVPLDAYGSIVTETIDGQYKINDNRFDTITIERVEGYTYTDLSVVFRVKGDSMYPHYKDSSKVYATWVDMGYWQFAKKVHVISLRTGSLMIKRIIPTNTQGTLLLQSDNPLPGNGITTITLDDVLAMWKVEYTVFSPAE